MWKGEFKQGLVHGQGNYKSSSGFEYNGSFVEGRFEGEGICRCEVILRPQNLVSISSVMPRCRWPNKCQYEGLFRNGVFHGKGKLTGEDGAVYAGDWKDGKRHGSGTSTSGDRLREYKGHWQNDVKHGRGAQQLSDGSVFKGAFANGGAGSHHSPAVGLGQGWPHETTTGTPEHAGGFSAAAELSVAPRPRAMRR